MSIEMLSKNQKLLMVSVAALLLHLCFFDYRFGGDPYFELGEDPLPLMGFHLFGIYGLGIHVFYNDAAIYFFKGIFIPKLFGLVVPVFLMTYVGMIVYSERRR